MIVKNLEKKEHSRVMFQVEIDAEAFEAAVALAFKKNKGSINVAGFRRGKAPRAVIEGMYGKDIFFEDAAQELAPEAFSFAVKEEKIENVGVPSFVDMNVDENKVCTLTFVTDVYPEVTLGEYKGIEAEYHSIEVSDEMVQNQIEQIRRNNARYVDVERPAQDGDSVVIDYEGFCDGVAFEGGSAVNQTLELGSGTFIPGFEEQLEGLAAGSEGEVNVTFPEQYHEDSLAGKPALFKVKVHTVREPQYPELDDEFAKDVSEFDTFEEFKNDVRAKLVANEERESRTDFRASIVTKAAENMEVEVPDGMVEEKLDEMAQNYLENMGVYGGGDVYKALGIDEASFKQMLRPGAVEQVRSDLLLDAVVKAENIVVSEEEKEEFYGKIAEAYGQPLEEIKKLISEEVITRDMSRSRAVELLEEHAVKLAPAAAEETEENKD